MKFKRFRYILILSSFNRIKVGNSNDSSKNNVIAFSSKGALITTLDFEWVSWVNFQRCSCHLLLQNFSQVVFSFSYPWTPLSYKWFSLLSVIFSNPPFVLNDVFIYREIMINFGGKNWCIWTIVANCFIAF